MGQGKRKIREFNKKSRRLSKQDNIKRQRVSEKL